ncbi:MAG: lactate racemase domain-containing protein [Armatimonadota bacterium]|nr:lactate racemase domain-containing protein [Armatimonadota bacterium]MDR7499271.1 lactate racemase domain-containing protein [Armatimonadota bacterium]MDR7505095.1 lactate racemase domain-containing protein [Armatimonadota bacterium]MDR7559012.1 lactate racemase domain-containing protein [Armatimonadota bacterium]MDR7573404.1 lactate racemase domain-containing protein [Armatimonadota bacterium]
MVTARSRGRSEFSPFAFPPEPFPLWEIRVTFPRPVAPFPSSIDAAVDALVPGRLAGKRIAVTAGSRGIRGIADILARVVARLKAVGAQPVVVAAMGSHGGATAEGQQRLLARLGITEAAVGAPILAEMDVVELGRTAEGLVAYCDRRAAECDGILVVNRIKPHTGFAEPIGSGLLKMLAVGLGKAPGAAQIHRQGPAGMAQAIEEIAAVFLASGKVLGGLAIIENAYDETADVVAVPPGEMATWERELFRRAKALMPRLPVDEADVLIVNEMGKNFSGTGMDVNIIGRWRLPGMPDPSVPRFSRIVVLRLSPESEGNAQGVGLADVVTRRLVDAIDPVTTYTNTITSTFLERGFIPITMPTDRDAIGAALASLALPDPGQARIVRIRNTLHLDRLWVSEAVLPALAGRPDVTVGAPVPLQFAADGTLADLA